jgi:hypothetical protein
MEEAYQTWGNTPSRLFAELAMAGAVPRATADAELRTWVLDNQPIGAFALAYLAERSDTTALTTFHRLARQRGNAQNEATGARPGYDERIARAYLLLARRDSAGALAEFTAIPDTLCLRCASDRLVEGRLLSAAGRHREAAATLGEKLLTILSPSEVAFQVELAAALRELDDQQAFQETCARVAAVWRRADRNQLRIVEEVCGTAAPIQDDTARLSYLDAHTATP